MARKRKNDAECELAQPLWAVVDGANCFGTDLTYDEALELVKTNNNGSMMVVTKDVASRIIK